MSRQRLRWGVPEPPPPKNPYRDTLLVYGGLAVVIVLVAWVTGGDLRNAALVAVAFFLIASAWTAYRWRARLREEAAEARERGEPGTGDV
jgi:membrane protein implicated in regulation of membrane protease activity